MCNTGVTNNGGADSSVPSVDALGPTILPTEDLLVKSLALQDRKALEACFEVEKLAVADNMLRREVGERLLPQISSLLKWNSGASCRKLRANDAQSVNIRYNSEFHRDRHLFGTAPDGSKLRRKEAWANLSAVVYLDRASFEYFEDTAWDYPKRTSPVKRTFEGGTMILFPSSLIHKASDDPAFQTNRRTVILFDIVQARNKNGASSFSTIPTAIIRMPWWLQAPVFHWVTSSKDFVPRWALWWLFSHSMYGWRFIPSWCRKVAICRVHWQITEPTDPGNDDDTYNQHSVIPLNSSIYMPVDSSYNKDSRITYYDFSNPFGYALRLVDAYTTKVYYTR